MCPVMRRFYSADRVGGDAAVAGSAPSGIQGQRVGAGATGLDGERDGNARPGVDRCDANVPVEVQYALAHAGNADPRSPALDLPQYVGGDARSFVLDVE